MSITLGDNGMHITLSHLNHKGCVASAKINQLLVFGDRNFSGPWDSSRKLLHMRLCFSVEGFVRLLPVTLLIKMVDSWCLFFGVFYLHDFGT